MAMTTINPQPYNSELELMDVQRQFINKREVLLQAGMCFNYYYDMCRGNSSTTVRCCFKLRRRPASQGLSSWWTMRMS